jgi:hypothetical protein
VPLDSIRALTDRQLAAWKSDPKLAAAQLYLISRADSLDVEVSRIGDSPTLSKDEVKALLTRAALEERPGFEVDLAGRRGYAYPLRQDTMLQGVWLIFPVDSQVDWAGWTRESLRFSQELFALREAGLGNPPTFRQLVEAFPAFEETAHSEPAPPLHWERSQSRVTLPVEDELSACLLVDHLPIF